MLKPRAFSYYIPIMTSFLIGCLVLFLSLDGKSKGLFAVWTVIGLIFYFSYGFWKSNVRRGVIDVEPLDPTAPGGPA